MDANATLAKTAKGANEVARHAHGLPTRLRSLLITVDGRATAGALISRFGEAAETESRLQYLIDQGFVEETRAWDPALLKQIETHFTRFVGPVAKVLVRRAARESTDVDELYVKLIQKLDSADGLEFIATRNRLFRPPQIAPTSRLRRGPEAARDEPPIWNPVLLKQVEMQFTRFVGPVAKVLVRRAQEETGDIEELYAKLADTLEPTDERLKFMATQPGVLPPEPTNDSPGWDRALLLEIERHFALFMGSSAKPIVRLAGKQTTYLDELYAMLSRMLNSPRDRSAFIATRNQLHVALPKRAVARPQRSASIKPPTPFDSGTARGERELPQPTLRQSRSTSSP